MGLIIDLQNYYLSMQLKNRILFVCMGNICRSPTAEGAFRFIVKNNNELEGLLTDGRSMQQRNKINALGLNVYFNNIVVSEEFGSEKPCLDNYLHFMKDSTQNNSNYFYIGDNPEKDFYSANKLGWVSICLKDNGQNIHKQNFLLDKDFLPTHVIDNILEILPIINEK